MAGKQAKILTDEQIALLLSFTSTQRHPVRNQVIALLSIKAGLRAAEIAKLTWDMVLDPAGSVGPAIELQNRVAKKGGGRAIPIHRDLRAALQAQLARTGGAGHVVRSERGHAMRPGSIVKLFKLAYQAVGLDNCSSHSGRRTFITRAARQVHRAGGSLRDVQLLAGHRSLMTTERYIEGDSDAQRRLVQLV